MKISTAKIYFNEHKTPSSADYGDVYFSNDNGAQETQYVFIEGNQLWQRFIAHKQPHFCIGETGFGTGANFFCVVHEFVRFKHQYPNHPLQELVFVSSEKHPIDIQDAHSIWQQWRESGFYSIYDEAETNATENKRDGVTIIDTLLSQWQAFYPALVKGLHRRHFKLDGLNITLDLHYGDAIDVFKNVKHQAGQLIDAWFLDGFAPSKNSSMWEKELFGYMASLSAPNATLATFTAAGDVKRGLQSVGFEIKKRKGFGRKRDMLIGQILTADKVAEKVAEQTIKITQLYGDQAPYYKRSGMQEGNSRNVAIIGNGLAGAIIALKCAQHGLPVDLYWQGEEPADCASGNPIGGFYPQLNAQNNYASQLQLQSFLYARHFYEQLAQQIDFKHSWCGALQLGFNENTKQRLHKLAKLSLWPHEIAHIVGQNEASSIANIDIPYDCLYLPLAGWISPPSLVKACIDVAIQTGRLNLHPNTKLESYTSQKDHINLSLSRTSAAKGSPANESALQHSSNTLIIATGHQTSPFVDKLIPLRLTRGQVEMVKQEDEFAGLETLLCHKGYFTPALNGFHAMGSTYIKNDLNVRPRGVETQMNFDMHGKSIEKASWQAALMRSKSNKDNLSRAAIRCSTPDHLPIVGSMPSVKQFAELTDLYKAKPLDKYPTASIQKNVFVLSGLGSRGLTTAPLLAEVLLSQIVEKPLPMPSHLLDAISPNRFIVKSLIKRQPISF